MRKNSFKAQPRVRRVFALIPEKCRQTLPTSAKRKEKEGTEKKRTIPKPTNKLPTLPVETEQEREHVRKFSQDPKDQDCKTFFEKALSSKKESNWQLVKSDSSIEAGCLKQKPPWFPPFYADTRLLPWKVYLEETKKEINLSTKYKLKPSWRP